MAEPRFHVVGLREGGIKFYTSLGEPLAKGQSNRPSATFSPKYDIYERQGWCAARSICGLSSGQCDQPVTSPRDAASVVSSRDFTVLSAEVSRIVRECVQHLFAQDPSLDPTYDLAPTYVPPADIERLFFEKLKPCVECGGYRNTRVYINRDSEKLKQGLIKGTIEDCRACAGRAK